MKNVSALSISINASAWPYNSALSLWLSVDPLSDKYPNLSPYVYCADNPVRLVDPNGREIGDYYDLYGKYLGWDGVNDNNVHIISDNNSQMYIADRTASQNRQPTATNDVNIKIEQTTKYEYLQKAQEVYGQGQKEHGALENGGSYDMNNKWQPGIGFKDHVQLTTTEGNATIHLHPWDTGEECYGKFAAPSIPSDKDLETFKNYQQNIIVGMSPGNYSSATGFTDRKPQICFYGNDGVSKSPNCTLGMDAVERIVQRGIRKGKL